MKTRQSDRAPWMQLVRALLACAILSTSLLVAGCSSEAPATDEESATSTAEELQVHSWNHVCRTSRSFFLYDNGVSTDSNRGEWVGAGHDVWAYDLAPGYGLVHVGDNVGAGHYGWIPKANLCTGR